MTDIIDAINSQKGKSAGPNGLFMEALVYGGHRLWIHFSLLFTFLRAIAICLLLLWSVNLYH